MQPSYPTTPRIHGNGFIQFDLGPNHRMHVWGHPDIPKQKVPTDIHDHAYSFTSWIMKGELVNYMYDIVPDEAGMFQVYEGRTSDSVLHPTGQIVTASRRLSTGSETLRAGMTYSMKAGEFHRSVAVKPTITIINKDGPSLAQGGGIPRVLCKRDVEPDNEFDRYAFPPELMFRILDEVLNA